MLREAGGRFILSPAEIEEIDRLYGSICQQANLPIGLTNMRTLEIPASPFQVSTNIGAAAAVSSQADQNMSEIERKGKRCYHIKWIRNRYVQYGRTIAEIKSEKPESEIWSTVGSLYQDLAHNLPEAALHPHETSQYLENLRDETLRHQLGRLWSTMSARGVLPVQPDG
jgi:hypothetical protein